MTASCPCARDEAIGESDPPLACLPGAAVTGAPPAGRAHKRPPIRLTVVAGASIRRAAISVPTEKGTLAPMAPW